MSWSRASASFDLGLEFALVLPDQEANRPNWGYLIGLSLESPPIHRETDFSLHFSAGYYSIKRNVITGRLISAKHFQGAVTAAGFRYNFYHSVDGNKVFARFGYQWQFLWDQEVQLEAGNAIDSPVLGVGFRFGRQEFYLGTTVFLPPEEALARIQYAVKISP